MRLSLLILLPVLAVALGGCNFTKSIDRQPEGSLAAIPQNIRTTNLSDVTVGPGKGVATRSFSSGKFVHTIAASLPALKPGEFYEGWLVRGKAGDADYDFVSTGKFTKAGDEYDLKYESDKDLSDHDQVIVTLEKVDDSLPEKHILEGKFE